MRVRAWSIWLGLALPLLAGCSSVAVRRVPMPDLFAAWRLSAAEDDHISPRTLQTLRRLDLEAVYQQDPAAALARLHALAVADPQPELVLGLAEVSFLLGRNTEKHSCAQSIAYYYLAAGYAYHFLFANGGPLTRDPEM